jgi:hypothetical protein
MTDQQRSVALMAAVRRLFPHQAARPVGKREPTRRLSIKSRSAPNGLFKSVTLNRGRQMAPASQGD